VRSFKNNKKMLTEKQKDLLIGSLLGDAHIEYNGKNCRTRFDHKLSHLEYVKWKQQILKPFSTQRDSRLYLRSIIQKKIYDKRTKLETIVSSTQKYYEKARFNTHTHSFFNYYRERPQRGRDASLSIYQNGRKIIPLNIKSFLNSNLALAVWYLDDGSLKTDCKAFKLHTNSYTLLKETLDCVSYFIPRIKFSNKKQTKRLSSLTSFHKQEENFVLYIGSRGSEADKFNQRLRPLVESEIPSMLYKFF
jgi:hypothetical protein